MAEFDRLWAPWRSTLFTKRPARGCIFCIAKRSRANRRHHVIARGALVFALLNRYPYNNGHLMIAPYRHVGTLAALSAKEWHDIFIMSQRLTKRLQTLLHPHGLNIGFNLGRSAGAGIVGHLHLHIVPRWIGDTNFMTALASTKVISQSLDALYTLLTSPES
ncbi:MAG: HIT domain-containing protein [Candidatus Omnitrophica bacterium]|nr:HIT domain-containing protein [Candidatus Omnitrophota bacterium]